MEKNTHGSTDGAERVRDRIDGPRGFSTAEQLLEWEPDSVNIKTGLTPRETTPLLPPKDAQSIVSRVERKHNLVTTTLLLSVAAAALTRVLVGYNTCVMNSPESVVFPSHTTAQWSFVVSSLSIGGLLGSIIGGELADRFGRKGALFIGSALFFLGGLIMVVALNIYWLIPARVIVGVAGGVASVVAPVYIGEIAPKVLKGSFGTVAQLSYCLGILLSGLAAFPLSTASGWRVLFALTPILCVVQMAFFTYTQESPRWLLEADPYSRQARQVIQKLRGYENSVLIEDEVAVSLQMVSDQRRMRSAVRNDDNFRIVEQWEIIDAAETVDEQKSSKNAMWNLLLSPGLRPLVVCTVILQLSQQLSGIAVVFYYSTLLFEGVIDDPLLGTAVMGFVNFAATVVALLLMDRASYRTLLLVSCTGCALSAIVITAALLGLLFPKSIAAFAIMSFVSFYEIGLGPIPWMLVVEMFSTEHVATAMSIASLTSWVGGYVVGIAYPFLRNALGPWSFFPFLLVILGVSAYVYYYLPQPATYECSPGRNHPVLVRADRGVQEDEDRGDDGEGDSRLSLFSSRKHWGLSGRSAVISV